MTKRALTHALVRQVGPSLSECALTHLPRLPIDPTLATEQHQAYVNTLRNAGLDVTVLPPEPSLADSVFVEDMAVILDECIIAGRASSLGRREEHAHIAAALNAIREVQSIEPPGTLEGGDVLVLGKTIFAGISSRTNDEGVRQLERLVSRHGYRVMRVGVHGCLHLKTAITCVAPGVLVANPQWIDLLPFAPYEILTVPDQEPWGANTLLINAALMVAKSASQTAELLRDRGFNVSVVDVSELQKAEAGLTCLSLVYRNAAT